MGNKRLNIISGPNVTALSVKIRIEVLLLAVLPFFIFRSNIDRVLSFFSSLFNSSMGFLDIMSAKYLWSEGLKNIKSWIPSTLTKALSEFSLTAVEDSSGGSYPFTSQRDFLFLGTTASWVFSEDVTVCVSESGSNFISNLLLWYESSRFCTVLVSIFSCSTSFSFSPICAASFCRFSLKS
ncbi:hypothetical protein AWRI1631_134280 [Saccharomyces cerevisiae AWRI1631]|uniref:Uncharacterized protein n=1 Tax=Saccharomyces cerevisiae (strain AWRI1631) TaxID=545124 RepID=B5VQ55_YEAS6|nr:hypothetical protein AWRI1631_134280 [Saccharomyces cerevisiae AWRI1631]